MPSFILAYHGGNPANSPEEGAELMKKWQAWAEGLGESLIIPGNPVGMSKTVSASGVTDDGGVNPLSGYSILEAENIDAAVEMVKSCPHFEIDGTIEVAEILKM